MSISIARVQQTFADEMSIIIITAIISLLIAAVFLIALVWSIRDGQYEDDFAPPNRILFDEKKPSNNQ